jgi:hypothetical protein
MTKKLTLNNILKLAGIFAFLVITYAGLQHQTKTNAKDIIANKNNIKTSKEDETFKFERHAEKIDENSGEIVEIKIDFIKQIGHIETNIATITADQNAMCETLERIEGKLLNAIRNQSFD